MTRIPLSRAEEEARLRRERLDLSIAEMGLSVRTTNCLEETGHPDRARPTQCDPAPLVVDQQFR